MDSKKFEILQRFRNRRPKQKGKLPNFTKDFQIYSERVSQLFNIRASLSFQFNKYGKEGANQLLISKIGGQFFQKVVKSQFDQQTTEQKENYYKIKPICLKNLKYRARNTHSGSYLIIRKNKEFCKLTKKQEDFFPANIPAKLSQIQFQRLTNKLPAISLTSRQNKKQMHIFLDKQNIAQLSNRSNLKHLHAHFCEHMVKARCYNRINHTVTMLRKQKNNEIS